MLLIMKKITVLKIKINYFQFGGLEALITGICDEWPRTIGRKREMFVAGLIVYCFFGALATTTYVSISISFAIRM